MRIVGVELSGPEAGSVHTIDLWFSRRRGAWIVERLDAEGGHIGHAHICTDREDAEACLAEWLRAHGETHVVGEEVELRQATRRAA